MQNILLRAATVLVTLPLWIGCATTAPSIDSRADAPGATPSTPDGRNPTRMVLDPDYPQAPPATGVEALSVPSYVYEPAATYKLGDSAAALVASGIELVVMDPAVAQKRTDRAADPGQPSTGTTVGSAPDFEIPQHVVVGAAPEQSLAPPALTTTFGSVDFDDNPAQTSGGLFIPPDPDAAAGPNHVVNVVNTVIRFHQKNGTVDFTDSLQDFFTAESPATDTFDPKVVFDPFAGRFVVVTLEKLNGPPKVSKIFLAVSDDADPNGMWCTTTIDAKTTILAIERWADYPGFAVDEEAVYIAANMFDFAGGFSVGVRLWVVDKGLGSGGLYDCGPAIVSKLDPYGGGGANVTTQPAQIHGTAPAGVGTFLAGYSGISGGGIEFVQVTRLDNPLTAPAFTVEQIDVGNIEDFASFLDAPQSGSATDIQTNDRRALDAEWFDNSLWMTASISPKAGDTDAGEITAHWWELDTSTLGSTTLADQGNIYGDDAVTDLWTFFPSVAVNGLGQVGFGYSGSASSIFASSYYTARNPADAAGSTQGTATLAAGAAAYLRTFCGGSNRWGDYTGADTDPVDGCFWFYNEHAMATGTSTVCPGPITEDGRWATQYGKMCPTGSCPADMFLDTITLSGTQTRKAGSRISTGEAVIVDAGADVTFQALDTVVFFNGLTVNGDLTVTLTANPCL